MLKEFKQGEPAAVRRRMRRAMVMSGCIVAAWASACAWLTHR
jgi:hypothetical protein